MNDFFNKMDYIYNKSKNEIDMSYNYLLLAETDFNAFLSNFFYGDTNKNMFLTGIFYEGPEFIKDFQDYIFKKSQLYFYDLFKIDGLKIEFNSSVPFSNLDVILSDSKIASINIYYKTLILYKNTFFQVIDEGINEKNNQISILTKEYNIAVNNLNNMKFGKFINKNKEKELMKIEMMGADLLNLENELSELLITRKIIEKNLVNVEYFQEKIFKRLKNKLNYNVVTE